MGGVSDEKYETIDSSIPDSNPYVWQTITMKKLTIEEMHRIAEERNGKCLSTKYINNHTKLEWMCSEGHKWEATPSNIKYSGTWCDICGGSKILTIEEMHRIAEARNGKCLSTKYINALTKLEWMCSEGHKWEATPSNIKSGGKWCRICSLKKRS